MKSLKIGDVAKALGVTASSLRFYEDKGVVAPQRSPGGTRFYSPDDVERFRSILDLTQAGVPIRVIQKLTSVRQENPTGDAASNEVVRLIKPILEDVKKKAALFSRVENDLGKALQHARSCHDCKKPPTPEGCHGCPIANVLTGEDGTNVFKVIWENHQ